MDLSDYRKQIDEIDAQLVKLFVARMNAAGKIGEYKRAHGLPVLNAAREQQVLDEVAKHAGEEFAPYIRKLYERMFEVSKEYQGD